MITLANTRLVSEVDADLYFECLLQDGSANLDSAWPQDTFLTGWLAGSADSLLIACSQDEFFTAFSDIQSGELYYLAVENGNRLALEQGGYILI